MPFEAGEDVRFVAEKLDEETRGKIGAAAIEKPAKVIGVTMGGSKVFVKTDCGSVWVKSDQVIGLVSQKGSEI